MDFLTFYKEAVALPDKVEHLEKPAADFINDLLQHCLDMEGPPPFPVEGLSTDYRREIVKTLPSKTRPTGTPRAIAETWITDSWRCLLIEIPSAAMQRARHGMKKPAEGEKAKYEPQSVVYLDNKSKQYQLRIVDACRSLGLDNMLNEAAVHNIVGHNRSFLAWRPRNPDETFNATLRGDTDNFFKNGADGLQKARILNNDRGVFRITGAKSFPNEWLTQPPALADEVAAQAHKRHDAGATLDQIKLDLVLSHLQMAKLFPGEWNAPKFIAKKLRLAAGAKPAAATPTTDLMSHVKAELDRGISFAEVAKASLATKELLNEALGVYLLAHLKAKADMDAEATRIGIQPHRAKKLLEAQFGATVVKGLYKLANRANRQTRDKFGIGSKEMDAALAMIQDGHTVPDASKATGVPVGRLRAAVRPVSPVKPRRSPTKKPKTEEGHPVPAAKMAKPVKTAKTLVPAKAPAKPAPAKAKAKSTKPKAIPAQSKPKAKAKKATKHAHA